MAIIQVPRWGQALTTISYHLFMESLNFPDLIDLMGYGVGEPEYDTVDAVEVPGYRLERGVIVPYVTTVVGARTRSVDYPILLPQGYTAWSELGIIAGTTCTRDLLLMYNCPPDDAKRHFYVFQDAIFSDIQRTSVFIENAEAGAPLTAQTTVTFNRERIYYEPQLALVQSLPDPITLSSVGYVSEDCVGCNPYMNQDAILGGATEDGDDAPIGWLGFTDNGFLTVTPSGHTFTTPPVVNDVFSENGRFILVALGSAAGTAGAILRSSDGVNFIQVYSGGASINAITRAGSYYIAVGAGGTILRSLDGSNWQSISNATYSAFVFNDVAYDPDTYSTYVAGRSTLTNGAALRISDSGAISNITSIVDFAGVSTSLVRVVVLGADHIAFGGTTGTAGFFSENPEVTRGDNFSVKLIGAGAVSVAAIVGDKWRTFIGVGTVVYRRDPYTEMEFIPMTILGNPSINTIVDGQEGYNVDGVNFGVFITTNQVLLITPQTPSLV